MPAIAAAGALMPGIGAAASVVSAAANLFRASKPEPAEAPEQNEPSGSDQIPDLKLGKAG
ncbi:MAG: hypothetical protein V4754_18980 [Pseudomonadota bacterium]